jgi:hypothetical protein
VSLVTLVKITEEKEPKRSSNLGPNAQGKSCPLMQEHRQQPSKHGCGRQLGKAPAHFSRFEMF